VELGPITCLREQDSVLERDLDRRRRHCSWDIPLDRLGDCYWERMRDFSHGGNSILANGLPSGGSAIVEIRATDAGFYESRLRHLAKGLKRSFHSSVGKYGHRALVMVNVVAGTVARPIRPGRDAVGQRRLVRGGSMA